MILGSDSMEVTSRMTRLEEEIEKYLQQIEEREKRLVIKLAKKHNWEIKYS